MPRRQRRVRRLVPCQVLDRSHPLLQASPVRVATGSEVITLFVVGRLLPTISEVLPATPRCSWIISIDNKRARVSMDLGSMSVQRWARGWRVSCRIMEVKKSFIRRGRDCRQSGILPTRLVRRRSNSDYRVRAEYLVSSCRVQAQETPNIPHRYPCTFQLYILILRRQTTHRLIRDQDPLWYRA